MTYLEILLSPQMFWLYESMGAICALGFAIIWMASREDL